MMLVELMNAYSKIYGDVITAHDVAKRFLRMRLFEGPIDATKLLRAAKIKGIPERTLRRAKAAIGVKARKDGQVNEAGQRTWRWHWPHHYQKSLGRESCASSHLQNGP